MKHHLVIYRFHLFLILAGILTCFSCKEEEAPPKVLRPVKYTAVDYLKGDRVRTFSGTSRTEKIINLSFRNSGIITSFEINLGQRVEKGQLLARLDNVQSRLAYEQALTQVNSATSQMNTAKLNLNRVKTLYEKGSLSLSDFEAARNSYRTAQQSYESAKRSVEIQKEQIRYGFLYAPANGTISGITAEVDENVSPGQVVAVLNAGTDMEISLGIPESVINEVKVGLRASVSFTSLPGKVYKGEVTEVAPAVDETTATYPVRVRLIDKAEEVRSGMAASVTFNFSEDEIQEDALVVPTYAVGEDTKGRFVFVINESDSALIVNKQPVTLGELTMEGFVVREGLERGQKIATAGLQTLLDGQEVKLYKE
ncbi:efflux RND transporter periplasmic adaptor subunit [Robertkochia marina]|uniref:efflux RND transporter periplasmic adaptor subunit n=1 Tax=Robertkochia marina TaxID=1227945 RepID=UPI001F5518BE|nr:efflux RND transporter periplasmic adaptor subunit [Robertkochia marina]